MARAMGKILLKDPAHDPFATVAPLLASADVRFANLEGPLSDQHGETMSPQNPLIFTGPPAGADALARAGFTIVSTANNHAWDYGKRGLVETLENLDRVGVLHAGTGRTREEAYRHVVVERRGMRLAFVAVTDIFNHGALKGHDAEESLARADAREGDRGRAARRGRGARELSRRR
jgi:poly-gamma-glutamate synthesis protein (capsule biosynthesis protein)